MQKYYCDICNEKIEDNPNSPIIDFEATGKHYNDEGSANEIFEITADLHQACLEKVKAALAAVGLK